MSSIGVKRRKSFPFFILNAAGVLDAKVGSIDFVIPLHQAVSVMFTLPFCHRTQAVGEGALVAACEGAGANEGWLGSYSIVRPGQLIGGPYTNNYYLGTVGHRCQWNHVLFLLF
jgi:hypothetical protein